MRTLFDRRDQKVLEQRNMRLGEIRFVPTDPVRGGAGNWAEMSAETWQLVCNDDDKGRQYTTARARAMRQARPSLMSLLGIAERGQPDALSVLEKDIGDLLAALRAIDEPTSFTAQDLLRRRQAVRSQLLIVKSRFDEVAMRFEVIDELLESKVLA